MVPGLAWAPLSSPARQHRVGATPPVARLRRIQPHPLPFARARLIVPHLKSKQAVKGCGLLDVRGEDQRDYACDRSCERGEAVAPQTTARATGDLHLIAWPSRTESARTHLRKVRR